MYSLEAVRKMSCDDWEKRETQIWQTLNFPMSLRSSAPT